MNLMPIRGNRLPGCWRVLVEMVGADFKLRECRRGKQQKECKYRCVT
jgi:hypothetical protein